LNKYDVITKIKTKEMSKILYFLTSFFLLCLDNVFTVSAFSGVTNGSNIDSFIPPFNIINESRNMMMIDAVGDIECSKILHDQLKKDNPTLFIALGDLCYKRDLTNFTNTYSDFKNADRLACVIGNHDSEENGNLKILNQALQYCGDHWYLKTTNNTTLLIGLNTNGNTSSQSNWVQSLVTNLTFMKGINNVMLLAHKPAHTPPGSDHQAENSTIQLFSTIGSNIPRNIQVYEIAAHNHLMAKSSNGHWFISGAGGKSVYEVSTDLRGPS
jgi:hypothetical protein